MKKKTIHIYSQYYFPVSNACSNRVEKYVMALKDEYDIKIVTGMPNYPTGIKPKKYKWKLFKNEVGEYGEQIIRTYEVATKNEGSISRIINYISFMFSSFLYGLFTRKPDIIIVTSPPIFTAFSVLLLNKIRKIPYILEIRDLWPDSVVALGFMKGNSLSYKIFSWLEKKLYKNASKIIGVTKGICSAIEKKGVEKDKIFLQYNSAEKIDGKGLENPYIELDDKIKGREIVLFAGNMNEAYDFEKASKYIKDNNKMFFVFIGDGSQKYDFQKSLLLEDNVLFLERRPKKEIGKYVFYSDKILVPLQNKEFYKGTFPVKGIEGIVNNKEIIFFGPSDGEFNKFLEDLKVGKENNDILRFKYFKGNIIGLLK